MATGIKDKVAILGMGCARFGERWDVDAESLMVEAFREALADAGIPSSTIQAAWLGVAYDSINIGQSGLPVSMALRLDNVPVTKVENYCASGTESLRGAVYAVASGACDIALAMGVEKLKDTGYGGLPVRSRGTRADLINVLGSAPGSFAQLATAYCAKHRVPAAELKRAMAQVSTQGGGHRHGYQRAHDRRAAGAL
jgi:acetyl-CoA C-acetyltransferase